MSKEDSSGEGKAQDASTPDTSTKDPNADIYENRKTKKIIRVVTVMAYLFSVSFVGILLSAYYIFLWEPLNPRPMQRLRTDPQMQFLLAPSSEETDLTKKGSDSLLQNEVSRVHKLFLGRMTHDVYDDSVGDPRGKTNLEKKQRLNMVLLKLRHSLVDTLRAQKRNLSQEISRGFNNSVGVLSSTIDRAENAISRYAESRGNMFEKKTYNDSSDLPPEFADSVSTLDVKSKFSRSKFTTIPGTETSQIHFDSVANPITEEKNHKKKHDTVESYLVREFSNATTNSAVTSDNDQRVSGNNDSFKMIKEFLKIDRKEPMKQSKKTDDRRLVSNHRENYSSDVQTSVTLEERVNGSIGNLRENYSNDNKSFSTDRIGQITRDMVSIDSSSHNLGFTDDPGFHQPDDPTVIKSRPRTTGTRDSEGERIRADSPGFLTALRE